MTTDELKILMENALVEEVLKLEHMKILKEITVKIYTSPNRSYWRDLRNLTAPYVKIFNHNKVTFPQEHEGKPNTTENVMVGLDDMETPPYDNYNDVLIQVTKNSWGFDMDIMLMGGYRKKVYFRGQLMIDQNEKRIEWIPLFRLFKDLKGETEPIL